MTPPLSPAIEAALSHVEFIARFHDELDFADDVEKAVDAVRAAILAEQQSLIGRIERLSARLEECERGVVEP